MARLIKEKVTELKLIDWCERTGFDLSLIYCKRCGKLLIYHTSTEAFFVGEDFTSREGNVYKKGDLIIRGASFLNTINYVTNYRLCVCEDCLKELYPDIIKKRCLFPSKLCYSYKIAYDIPEDEWKEWIKNRQSVTEDKMIKTYGEEEGIKRWKQYCNKQAVVNTFEYKHKKYGMSLSDFKKYNKSRSVTLDNLIKRHGIERGTEIFNEYCSKQRYSCSEEYFIEKYGEEEGLKIFKNFEKSRECFNNQSNIAIEFFEPLVKSNTYYGDNIRWCNSDDGEYVFVDKETYSLYKLDYYDITKNILIEFYGDYWHSSNKVEYKVQYDLKRIDTIINKLKCKVIIVWEHFYKSDKLATLIKVQDIIDNIDNENTIVQLGSIINIDKKYKNEDLLNVTSKIYDTKTIMSTNQLLEDDEFLNRYNISKQILELK